MRGPGPGPERRFDEFCRRLIARSRAPGIALLGTVGGRSTLERAWGQRDAEERLPVTLDTVHGIASVTKSFTALAILQLAEEGRLRVRDAVQRHLPEFRTPEPRRTRRMTIHHFLTHTSGLPPLPTIYHEMARSLRVDKDFDARAYRRVGIDIRRPPTETYEEVLEFLARTRYRLLGEPGQFFSYSNDAFGLLGAVIERVSGQRYERFLEDRIFRPAGLTHTLFDPGMLFRSRDIAVPYTPAPRGRGKGPVRSPVWHEMSSLRAAGAIRTNSRDLSRYLEIYRTGGRVGRERIAAARTIRAMLTPHVEVTPGTFYGYGLAVLPNFHGTTLVEHGGGLKGVASGIAVVPRRGIAVAALSNYDLTPTGRIVQSAVNLLMGLPIPEPTVRYSLRRTPFGPLAPYAGWYGSGEGWWLTVRPRRRGLVLDFHGIEITDRKVRLRPTAPDRFVTGPRAEPALVTFWRGPRGRVDRLSLGWRILRRRSVQEFRRLSHGRVVW
jgi:CubicO group peptidase (beta-lactamase class C family)